MRNECNLKELKNVDGICVCWSNDEASSPACYKVTITMQVPDKFSLSHFLNLYTFCISNKCKECEESKQYDK